MRTGARASKKLTLLSFGDVERRCCRHSVGIDGWRAAKNVGRVRELSLPSKFVLTSGGCCEMRGEGCGGGE